MYQPISGVWAAALTPLTSNLEIDLALLAEHSRRVLGDGADGIVLFGSTGEAASFSVDERMAALDGLLEAGITPDQLVVGTGCPSLPDTVTLTRHALESGARGSLVMPPYFYKSVADDAVLAYYSSLFAAVPKAGMYLYHFPKLSAVPISPEIIQGLAARFGSQLVGLKDSTGDPDSLACFFDTGTLSVMPGTERLLELARTRGGRGVITASANVSARLISDCWSGADSADPEAMMAVRAQLEQTGTIPTMKAWLAHRFDYPGWNRVRPPLSVLSDSSGALAPLDALLS